MNKSIIMFCAVVFSTVGSFLPMLFGNDDIFSLWSIGSGVILGLFGVWVGVQISKRVD